MTHILRSAGIAFSLCLIVSGCDVLGDNDGPPSQDPVWTKVSGLPSRSVDVLTTGTDVLYAGAENRLCISRDDGSTWAESTPLPELSGVPGQPQIASIVTAGDRLFVGTFQHGVFEFQDEGTQWTTRTDGLSNSASRAVLSLVVRGDYLYAGTGGASVLQRPLQEPGPWQPFRTGIPSLLAWDTGDLALHADRLVAGAGTQGVVYLNIDGSTSWTEVSYVSGEQGAIVYEVEGAGPSLLLAASNGLYRSSDQGETWIRMDGSPDRIIGAVFARDPSSALYAAVRATGSTATQLYVFTDDGASWSVVEGASLSGAVAYSFAATAEHLYLGREDGLWRLPIPDSAP